MGADTLVGCVIGAAALRWFILAIRSASKKRSEQIVQRAIELSQLAELEREVGLQKQIISESEKIDANQQEIISIQEKELKEQKAIIDQKDARITELEEYITRPVNETQRQPKEIQ